jgi:SAM-dependent methyltransferase
MVFWSRFAVLAPGWPRALPAIVWLVTALTISGAEPARAGPGTPPPSLGRFEPSPIEIAERMLQLASVTLADVVYDLGSGDGRIVILAARRYGARGVGVEIDPHLVWFSRQEAKRHQVEHLVTLFHADALTADVSAATVVTLFLTPQANLLLRPKLQRQLRPGARVVSHEHHMGDWAPERVERVRARSGTIHTLYLWRIGG